MPCPYLMCWTRVTPLIAFIDLRGWLAETMRDLDKDVQHLDDALGFYRKAGYRSELAWTCCDYADTLLAAAQGATLREDRAKGMSLED